MDIVQSAEVTLVNRTWTRHRMDIVQSAEVTLDK